MGRRTLLTLLAVLLLSALVVAGAPEPPTALLVPLDDRPSTLLFPLQVARIAGGRLAAPPRRLLGRAWRPGDPEALARWLEEAAPGAERAFVSADMLCYGGLIASRTAAAPEEEAVARLAALDPVHRSGAVVEVLATIPRLHLRTSDVQAPYEKALAHWAASGSDQPPAGVPPEIVAEYLGVRRRNLRVLRALLDRVQAGTVARLVIGQDDAAPAGPHVREQQEILAEAARLRLGDRVVLVSGADELAMNLVAGWLARRAGVRPRLALVYSDPEAGSRLPPLESRPLDEAVREHLALSGAERAPAGEGDLDLFVEVPSDKPFAPPPEEASPEDRERSRTLVDRVRDSLARGRRVGVADLRLVNRADPALAREILDRVPLWKLEAYAAWNTPSNALGTAIAQAVAHRVALERGRGWPGSLALEGEKTHQAFTLARMVDDYAYQAMIRPRLQAAAAGLPRDPDPLLNLYGPVGLEARLAAVDWAQQAFAERLRGRTWWAPAVGRWLTFEAMNVEVVLPWPRVFEVEVRLDLRLAPVGGPAKPWKPGTSPAPPSP